MKTIENLYLGDKIRKPDKYLHKLETGKIIKKFYIVVLLDDKNTLEIYPSYVFLQSFFRKKQFHIVAITLEEATAIEYIRKLSEISVRKFNDFDANLTIDSLTSEDMDFLYSTPDKEDE